MNAPLPNGLAGYEQLLAEAIRRDLGARRRRKLALRGALTVAVIAALAVGALSVVSRPASGASVVHRAAAAIARSPGTILHVDMLGTQNNPDGSVVTWRDESWQQESAPYARRQLETGPEGTVTESASTRGSDAVYDPKTDTIYVSSHSTAPTDGRQSFKVLPGPRPGTFVLRLDPAGVHVVITARQAKGFREGRLVAALRLTKENGAATASLGLMRAPRRPQAKATAPASDPDPSSGEFRDQILELLNSGGATVAGSTTIDGREAIEIDSADGHTTYFVDPNTYAPVELRTRGNGGGTALRFRTYDHLALAGNAGLLSLEAQHPAARVDHDPADYRTAESRLFPHG